VITSVSLLVIALRVLARAVTFSPNRIYPLFPKENESGLFSDKIAEDIEMVEPNSPEENESMVGSFKRKGSTVVFREIFI
jgi:hypothetical protein